MAECQSLTALALQNLCESYTSGVQKVYIIAAKDLGTQSGSTMSYAVSPTTGVVSDIALKSPATTFVQIGQMKNVAGLTSDLTKNVNGTSFFTNTATLSLTGLSPATLKFVESIRYQPVAIIMQSRSGGYYAVGLDHQMELATLSISTGISESDNFGVSMTLTSISAQPQLAVEQAAVAEVIA